MEPNYQRFFPWTGPIFIALLFVGMWPLAGLLPPMTPTMTPAEVSAFYQNHTDRIRLGVMLMMTGCAFFVPWTAIISDQIRRIPRISHALVTTQQLAGIGNCLLILFPMLLFSVTAFRPDRDPAMTFMLNDLSWIVFIMPFCLGVLQMAMIGLAILTDPRAEPAFPRWVGYLNLWVGLGLAPSGLVTFFKSGPFAWSGLFSYWIPFGVFLVWFMVMFFFLRRLVGTQAASSPAQIEVR